MDRFDRIIRHVQDKTDEGTIRWSVVSPEKYSGVLLNAHRVIRCFESDHDFGAGSYRLVFVERKIDYHDEFGSRSEIFGFELFVMEEDKLVIWLYDGLVDSDALLKLSNSIDDLNDRTRRFFSAFNEPDAA